MDYSDDFKVSGQGELLFDFGFEFFEESGNSSLCFFLLSDLRLRCSSLILRSSFNELS